MCVNTWTSQIAAESAMSSGVAQATTRKRSPRKAPRTKAPEKDLVTRLADAGEDALHRLAELPGGHRAVSAFSDLRSRVDELGKKVRGIDALEARIAKLEKEVAAQKKRRASTRRPATRKPS
jgi:flagellar motility protein MotE (MotC chaperone)